MKKPIIVLITFLVIANVNVLAYDIAVENEDGITIYYNYSDNGEDL